MSYLQDTDLYDVPAIPNVRLTGRGGFCSVVESNDCAASPGLTHRVSTKCYACGDYVCRACSLVKRYLRYGSQRLCFTCIRDGCLMTLPRGQMSLLGSKLTAQRDYGVALVERTLRKREAYRDAKYK